MVVGVRKTLHVAGVALARRVRDFRAVVSDLVVVVRLRIAVHHHVVIRLVLTFGALLLSSTFALLTFALASHGLRRLAALLAVLPALLKGNIL